MSCDALLHYQENIIPAALGTIKALAAEAALRAKASRAARSIKHGGQLHTRALRGDYWQRVMVSLRWRGRWNKRMSDQGREAFAAQGY